MSTSRFRSRRGAAFALATTLVASLLLPQSTLAAVSTRYRFTGLEVWFTSTVGTFVGAAAGSAGDGATWKADIQHTVRTIPSGRITGGYAELLTTDLTKVHGDFSSGNLTLVSSGSGTCGNLTHKVRGKLVNVTRSDGGRVGTGRLVAKLTHYRMSIFGQCIAYSASVSGSFYLTF